MDGSADSIWEDLRPVVGENLRVVTKFERMDYDAKIREDLRQQFSDEIPKYIDHNIVDRFSETRLRESAGFRKLETVVRFYEEAVVASWAPDELGRRGVIVSFDRDGEPETTAALGEVLDYLSEPGFNPFAQAAD